MACQSESRGAIPRRLEHGYTIGLVSLWSNDMRILSIAALLGISVCLFSACGGGGANITPAGSNGTDPQPPVDPLNGLDPVVDVAGYALSTNGAAAVSELITYRMPGVTGGVVEAKAAVLLPPGPAPAGGFPVIAWGHGTTGVADSCAPSVTGDLAGYAPYLDQYVQNGFAVIAPDYEGLGSDGVHPYLHLASAGRSITYAVNAAVQQYADLSPRYAVVGHSQGGHAVLGAGRFASEIDSIELVGVAAIAPASNIVAQSQVMSAVVADDSRSTADRVDTATRQMLYSALILNTISVVDSSFDIASVYGSNGGELRTSVNTQCATAILQNLLPAVTGSLLISNSTDSIISTDVVNVPQVAQFLEANEPGSTRISVPVLLVQGLIDETVYPESTAMLSNSLIQLSTDSTLVEYPTGSHGSVVNQSAEAVLNFVAALF